MRQKILIPLVVLSALTLFCGAAGRKAPSGEKTPKDIPAFEKKLLKAISSSQAQLYKSTEDKVTFFYSEGLLASQGGDTLAARAFFNRALTLDSLHAPSYYELANIASSASDALKYSTEATRLDSTNTWYKMQLGRVLIANEKYDSALVIYEELIEESPSNPDNYRMLAALHEHTGKPFMAISVLDSAENVFGKIEELAEYKRQLLIRMKLYDKAIEEAKALTVSSPYNEDQFVVLGELYSITNKDSLALDAFDKALTINPKSLNAIVALNEYFRLRGNNSGFLATTKKIFQSDDVPLERKIEFFNNTVRKQELYTKNYAQVNDVAATLAMKYPDRYEAKDLYARHLLYSGLKEEALRQYKSYISDTTTNAEPFKQIIGIESYLMARPDSVAKYSAMAIKRAPADASLYTYIGASLAHLKKYPEAEKGYALALKYAHDDSTRSVACGALGDLYYQSGNKGYAKMYDKAINYNPDNAGALNNYSYYLALAGKNLDKALAMTVRANELSPSNPTFLDTYGWVLYKRGEYEQAKKIMRTALSLDRENNPELMVHYGDVLLKTGDTFMATVYWKKALEQGYNKDEIEKRLKSIEQK